MIVQYILKASTPAPIDLSEERELWHLYGSKRRAEELGLVQLMFSCVPCAAKRAHKRCVHYDQPLVYIREEDPDYEKQQEIEKGECLTIFIDTQVTLRFVTEDIPRCSQNGRLNVHQCPLGDDCLCYYYRYTYVLNMEFIPLLTLHRAFGRVLPEIPEFEATPYLGPPDVRHAYRAWKLWSEGKKHGGKALTIKTKQDDKLAEGDDLNSKMLELFKFRPQKDWRGWGLMDENLLKVLKDRRITDYESLREYFSILPLSAEEGNALGRRNPFAVTPSRSYYVPNDGEIKRLRIPTDETVLEYDYSGLLQYADPRMPAFCPPLLVEVPRSNSGGSRSCHGSHGRSGTSVESRKGDDSETESEVDV